VSQFFHFCRK